MESSSTSKSPVPIIVGSTVGGFLFLLIVIVVLCRRRFRMGFKFKFPELHRSRQSLSDPTLPIFTPHDHSSSSMGQRELPRDTGRNQAVQSLGTVFQERKPPTPELLSQLQLQNPTGHYECSQGSRPPQADGTGQHNVDELVERAVQGLQSQLDVMALRMFQLEGEVAEQAPPRYTPSGNPSHPSD
ncbi:hypothetical protein AAF712_016714 [Marasmius tenuissimus]|uniref:Uncharacterized protein n=1 Tax=Marasmius tenuissimus TaxID=585030 RepID=A0ABR2Z6S8_9AGAR